MINDKPKRKNTPSRQRKVLLFFMLPIVALIAGLMALSPQIDAQEMDTPQCHFEEDRLFITGHPYQLTSINRGQYEPLWDSGAISQLRWSPDGTMFTARDPMDSDEMTNLMLVSADGEVLQRIEKDVSSSVNWSHDSRYFEFSSFGDNRYTIETEELFSYITPMDGFGMTFDAGMSPNGRYMAYVMSRGRDYSSWFVNDIEMGYSDISIGSWRTSDVIRFAGWSADSRYIYFVTSDVIKQFDMQSRELTDLLELPHSLAYVQLSLSPNADKIILWDEANGAMNINLDTREIERFGEDVFSYKLGWLDNRYWIYGELRNEDVYESIHVYDAIENTSRQLNLPAGIDRYEIELSPSGRYLQYLRVIATESNLPSNYAIYDLETDVEHIIGSYAFEHRLQWFSHEDKDYILIQKQVTADQSQPYLTTLMDVENFSSCQIGYTAWTLEFQPQG